MAFTPRTQVEILTDMIAYVRARTGISDFAVGSVIRTLLEAASIEDDEQYFQMVQLLDLFSVTTASGELLDRRLADYNIVRERAKAAIGKVRVSNTNLISEQVAQDAIASGTSVKVFDSIQFPSSGFPYTIRISEGTARVQDVDVIALNTSTNTFTLDALTPLIYAIEVGDRVSLVDGASGHTVNSNTGVQAPPTTASAARLYELQEPATILAGNYYSNEVLAKASTPGAAGNVGVGRVTQFTSSAPFAGAGVTNTSAMSGGRDRESDEDFRARALEKLQALSRGTRLALKSNAVGVEDPTTFQRVTSANVVEDIVVDEVLLYIDDGTGFEADTQPLPSSSLAASTTATVTVVLDLDDGSDFPSAGWVLIGTDELVFYSSKPTADQLALSAAVTTSSVSGTIVRFVDVVTSGAESGQRRFSFPNFPVVRGSDRVYIKALLDSSWTLLSRDTDYKINRGTGEFCIVDEGGLSTGTSVVASYSYYTNLVAEVQKVLEGNEDDATNYPGVKAAGIFLSVEAPTIKRITVRATITAAPSYKEEDLAPLIVAQIEDYISSLKIGEDVFRSKIIDAAHNVQGLQSITVSLPSSDSIVVLDNELPVPYDSSGNSLVTVL